MAKINMVETDEESIPTELEEKKEEKETPSESPTEEKPADEEEPKEEEPEKEPDKPEEPEVSDDAEDRETKGLKAQQDKLKTEVKSNIVNLRAQRREQRKTPESESKPVEVEDFEPEETARMDKFLKEKGYVPKDQIVSEFNRKDLLTGMTNADDKFLDDHPEYIFSQELRAKHDNIMDSLKETLTTKEYEEQLKLAHDIVKDKNPTLFPSSSDQTLAAKKQALDIAGMGKGGKAGSPPTESTMSSGERDSYRRAGFSEEDIKRMDKIKQNQ